MLIINDNVDHLLYDARLRLHPLQLPRENMIWSAACKDIIDNQCKDHINHRRLHLLSMQWSCEHSYIVM